MPFILFVLLTANIQSPNLTIPTTPVAQAAELSVPELKAMATEIAKAHGLHVQRFLTVIEKESGWDIYAQGDFPDGKGGWVRKDKAPPGSQATSIGLCQLHYPTRDWGIATSSAENPRVCLEIMAKEWERGNASRWSVWTALYGMNL